MASEAIVAADVCPTEDAVVALLEYLVDPRLPAKSSVRVTPSQSDHEAVAKQVHAVVLLYNYYHRKQHPQLEFLGFEKFCKLAVVSRPALLAYLRLLQRSDGSEFLEPSLTEKKIMDACDISMSLDASKNAPTIDGWPISKVAVLLVDFRKENFLLQFGSITEGVWSVIEKEVDACGNNSEGTIDSNYINKKKRIIRKPLRDNLGTDEASCQQLAFSAVKEATGIIQGDLIILESHVAYSTSKEKAAVQFYIMQCTKPNINDLIKTPIRDAINSLQGPLVTKSSCWWTHTSVVEYAHLLPYAGILSDWLSGEGLSNSLQDQRVGRLETINVDSSKMTEKPSEPEISKRVDRSHVNDSVIELLGSKTSPETPKQNGHNGHLNSKITSDSLEQKYSDGCCTVDLSDDFDGPNNMEVDDSSVVQTQNKDSSRNISNKVQSDNYGKMATSMERCLKGTSDDKFKAEIADSITNQGINEGRGRNVSNGDKNCNIISSDQDRIPVADHALLTFQSNSKILGKLDAFIASKDKELSQAALKVLLSKRDKLSFQQREIEDQIAQCDKDILTILNGGEDDLALKIESIIEGCNAVCPRSGYRGRSYQHGEDHCSPQCFKRKRLPDTSPSMQNPCQELDDVCYENNWTLPTYHVSPVDGGFRAGATVKGIDFECSSEGDLHFHPREARESAAAQMLAKLCNVPNVGQ